MTAQRKHIKELGDLKHIASVRCTDLEMRQARSQGRLRQLEATREMNTEKVRSSYDGWRQAMSGRSFDPATASFWSTELLRAEALVKDDTAQIETARQACADLQKQQAAAVARHDAVSDLLRAARRSAQLRRDEAALEAHSRRSLGGWGEHEG